MNKSASDLMPDDPTPFEFGKKSTAEGSLADSSTPTQTPIGNGWSHVPAENHPGTRTGEDRVGAPSVILSGGQGMGATDSTEGDPGYRTPDETLHGRPSYDPLNTMFDLEESAQSLPSQQSLRGTDPRPLWAPSYYNLSSSLRRRLGVGEEKVQSFAKISDEEWQKICADVVYRFLENCQRDVTNRVTLLTDTVPQLTGQLVKAVKGGRLTVCESGTVNIDYTDLRALSDYVLCTRRARVQEVKILDNVGRAFSNVATNLRSKLSLLTDVYVRILITEREMNEVCEVHHLGRGGKYLHYFVLEAYPDVEDDAKKGKSRLMKWIISTRESPEPAYYVKPDTPVGNTGRIDEHRNIQRADERSTEGDDESSEKSLLLFPKSAQGSYFYDSESQFYKGTQTVRRSDPEELEAATAHIENWLESCHSRSEHDRSSLASTRTGKSKSSLHHASNPFETVQSDRVNPRPAPVSQINVIAHHASAEIDRLHAETGRARRARDEAIEKERRCQEAYEQLQQQYTHQQRVLEKRCQKLEAVEQRCAAL